MNSGFFMEAVVSKSAPRLLRKPSNGVSERVVADPPPFQLISRRPLARPGALALLGFPKAARKAFTVACIDAASSPRTGNVMKLPKTPRGEAKLIITDEIRANRFVTIYISSKMICLFVEAYGVPFRAA